MALRLLICYRFCDVLLGKADNDHKHTSTDGNTVVGACFER